MKLLLIVDRFDRSTLCESAWWSWDVAAQAIADGHRVEAVCLCADEPEADTPAGVTVYPHSGPHDAAVALATALARQPDVVHLGTPGPLGPHVTDILRHSPLVVDVHGHWPVCPQGDLMRRPTFQRCDLRYPADACATCAGFERLREMESRTRLLARAPAIVAHAPFQAYRLSGLLERAVPCVGYGVDTQRFRPDPPAAADEGMRELIETRDRRRVLFLGPPTHSRGVDFFLDVVVGVRARAPGTRFIVAGADPENPGWAQTFFTEAGEMGIAGEITVLDRVPPDDLPALLAACDVGVSPALWDDAGGMFVLQALAAGLPTVTSGRGILAQLAEFGAGMVASPETAGQFADRVAMLLAHPAARAVMSEAARLHAVEHHDRGRSLEAIDAIHRQVAGESLRRAA